MNAKDYMMQLKKLNKIIENKRQEKAELMDIAAWITARAIGERVQSSGSKTKMADSVDRYVDIEREIESIVSECVAKKTEIIGTIEKLNVTEYDVLYKVYVQDLTLYDAANQYGKSKSWADSVHGRALANVQKIIDKKGE